MEDLFIPKTKYTPEIQFLKSGHLTITGLSLLENSYEMYLKSIDWLKSFAAGVPREITLHLKLDYLDTSSVRSIVDMVKLLNSFKEKGFPIVINWYYEHGDDDFYEVGEAMQAVCRSEFNLIEKTL